jgi:hypothetical protein
LSGEPELVPVGVPCGVWKGVEVGVDTHSEDAILVTAEEEVLVVLERMRVVLVPWMVEPPRLSSLVLVLWRGVGAGEMAMPRAEANLASFCRRSTMDLRRRNSPCGS